MNSNNNGRVLTNYVQQELQPLRERIARLEAQLAKLQPEQPKRMPWTAMMERKTAR